MESKKYFFDDTNYSNYLKMVKASKLPYTLVTSNYTFKIVSEFVNKEFLHDHTSKQTFAAYQKLRQDVLNCGIEKPEIDRAMLDYFFFSIPKNFQQKDLVHCIDIKSAYAYSLKNKGIVTDKTFEKISELKKKERLACVGMLASKKKIFEYGRNNQLIKIETKENPLSDFFFMAVFEIQELMRGAKKLLGNDFLFYWVDCVYYLNEKNTPLIQNYFDEKG